MSTRSLGSLEDAHGVVRDQTHISGKWPYYLFLPAELLEIFTHICDQRESLDLISTTDVILPGPFLLGKICRYWRQLVFSSPSLWAYTHLVFHPSRLPGAKKFDALLLLLQEYLHRSNHLPLTIRLGMTRRNALFAREQYRSLYKLLIQECYRWKDIEVFDCASLVVEYMQQTPPSLPLLQSASFGTSRTPIVLPRLDVIFVQNAPQLRSLSLTSMMLPEGGLSYYHLTHFTASNLLRSDLLDILRLAPSLRSCVLVETGGSLTNTMNPPLPKVVLKHLDFLTARNCPGLEELFEGIASVPALRDFRCTAGTAQHPPLGSIKDLLHRSQCKLETLQIGTGLRVQRGVAMLLGTLLRQSETLTRLMLRFGIDEAFPESVTTILNPPWSPVPSRVFRDTELQLPIICPNLQHLEMEFTGGSVLPILQMLKNRWLFGTALGSEPAPYGGHKLTKIVSACFPEWCRREVILQLGEEIKEGLVVDFFPETPEEKMLRLIADED